MTCPLGATTVKACLATRSIEFRRVRPTWEPFCCESCKVGIANEATIKKCRLDVEPTHRYDTTKADDVCPDCGGKKKRHAMRCRKCYDVERNMAV